MNLIHYVVIIYHTAFVIVLLVAILSSKDTTLYNIGGLERV